MSNTAEIAVVPLTAPDQGCHVPEHGCEGRASHAKTGTPFGAAQDAPPVGSPSLAGKGLGVRSASEWLRSLAAGAAKVLANAAQGNSAKADPSEKTDPPAKNDNVWAKLWDFDFADLEKLFQTQTIETQTTEEIHSASLADSAKPSASPPPPANHGSGASAADRPGNPGANAAAPAPELSSDKQHADRAALDHLAAQWMANGFGRVPAHAQPNLPVVGVYNSEIDPWVYATDADAAEYQQEPGQFTVYRTGPLNDPLTVYYAIGGTATPGAYTNPNADYQELPGSVTIQPGFASEVIWVLPFDDSEPELDETVIITLLPHFSYVLSSPTVATVTIASNDPPTVGVFANIPYAMEAGTMPGNFIIYRNGPVNDALTVYYSISGTATADTDYEELSGVAVIPEDAIGIVIFVQPFDNSGAEPTETVVLTLDPDAAYLIGDEDGSLSAN